MATARLKKGDTVVVLSGKDKGREGKILRVYTGDSKILLEGINMRKRHQRPKRGGEKGSIVQIPAPLPSSKAMLLCPSCGKPARIGFKLSSEGKKMRVCKKCKAEF
jgi:large subunit ribosomal protein L24